MIEKRQNSVDDRIWSFTLDSEFRSRICFAKFAGGFFDNNGEDIAPPMDY